MPIYVVNDRNQRVTIPAGPLSVSITGSVNQAELDIDGMPAQSVMRTTAHQALLPQLTERVALTVRPVGSPRFGPGTVVHLAIAQDDSDDVDPCQVFLDPVDVSGEAAVVFAELHPHDYHVEIRVAAVADTPLGPLAAAARTAARQIIGRGAAPAAGDLTVAVNASASMRPWFLNGSAAAATDVVVGVADALGIFGVDAVLVGGEPTPVRLNDPEHQGPVPVARLAEALRRTEPRWSAGARWSRLQPAGRVVVCSDYPTSTVPQRFPLITFSGDGRITGPRLPAPRPGQDAAAELLANPQVIEKLATGLVQALT